MIFNGNQFIEAVDNLTCRLKIRSSSIISAEAHPDHDHDLEIQAIVEANDDVDDTVRARQSLPSVTPVRVSESAKRGTRWSLWSISLQCLKTANV